MKSTKGFTLIELLVVISIIALLSSVVLSSLQSARIKGADSAVKSSLKQLYAQGELYRNDNGGYGSGTAGGTDVANCTSGMFADSRVATIQANIVQNAATTPTLTCSTASNGQNWAMSVVLRNGAAWCIDNTGDFKAATAASGQCP
ncbi:MAG: hypothetical protein RLZZ67_372 [Candidatus Parcubacteria bacterium]|jgi:prepilin-type N-terminal cleavage/methylation domain-containing protein